MALTIRSIKYCCIRNSGAFPSATKQTSPSAPDPHGEVPARRPLSRQELAFFCGKAQMPGVKWCWATTAFRNQKSWVPNTFLEVLNPHLHFPVQCSHHQVRLTFSLIPDPFPLHTDTASTGGEEKHCGKENSTANPWHPVTPVTGAVHAAIYPREGIWYRNPSYGTAAALQQLLVCIPQLYLNENEIIQGRWISQWERSGLLHTG